MDSEYTAISLSEPIAIIGMGCRFPGKTNSPEAFWKLMLDGVDAVCEVPEDRWDIRTYYHPDPAQPGKMYIRHGGFLEKIDQFEPEFFGISPREAERIDPQQRLLLEVAWEALEDAGQVTQHLAGTKTGVFVGICTPDYSVLQSKDPFSLNAYTNVGGAVSIAANRISYVFDFHGPSLSVDSACSSSLLSVHLACQSIWKGESTLALAGGASIIINPESSIGFCKASMLSQKGRCSSFDAEADGFVRGEGVGIAVLKPLSKAIADGDPIYATILATGVNQDGRTSGISLPNRVAQEDLLREVYKKAGVSPEQVQYVEAHGTGTPAGDPIECYALGNALGADRPPGNYLRIGSVKTNIGHLEGASGIAGLMKVALSTKHRQIPGNLHFKTPNPKIPFDDLRLKVQQTAQPWSDDDAPAIAGVNAFGFGGTNVHVVLKEFVQPPKVVQEIPSNQTHLLPLSARSPEALQALAQSYLELLTTKPSISIQDLCYTASVRRDHHPHRLALVGLSREQLIERLEAFLAGENRTGMSVGQKPTGQAPKIVFVFSGNGPQWWAMGRQLLEEEPVFQETIQTCDRLLRQYASWSLLEELKADEFSSRMERTDIAQPALFALQVALMTLWRSWGIEPDATIGHSVGEVAAAYAAGVLSLEDAIRTIYHRSRVQELTAGNGKMAAVGLSVEEARHAVAEYGGHVSVASINSPKSVTLSGDSDALEQIVQSLEEKQVFCRVLRLNYAFHSHHMEPIREDLLNSLQDVQPQLTSIRFISTVTGKDVIGSELGGQYWWNNVRQPVQFLPAVEQLIDDGYSVFLEIGPHPVLSGYISECLLGQGKQGTVLSSLRRKEDERAIMLTSLASLYTLGYPLDWNKLYVEGGRCIPLPFYPWQRERYWNGPESAKLVHPLLGCRLKSAYACWEIKLDKHLLAYLEDHQVQGSVVFPAAGYIEMGLAAATEFFGESPCVIENFEIQKPLVLTDTSPPTVQVTVSPEDASFRIYSRTQDGQQAWTTHVTGQLRKQQPSSSSQKIALDKIRERCDRELSQVGFYREAAIRGLEYGPSFQGIERVFSGEGEAIGQLRVPDSLTVEFADYKLHPAILDACVQVIFGVLPAQEADKDRSAYLPVSIEQFRYYARPSHQLYCHVCLVKRGSNYLNVDCSILDEDGNLVAEIRGFRLQAINFNAKTDDLTNQLYELKWQLKPLPKRELLSRNSDYLPSPLQLAEFLQPEAQRLSTQLNRPRYYQEERPLVDALGSAYIVAALRQLGFSFHPGERFLASVLRERTGVLLQYEGLLNRLLAMLEDDGILKNLGSEWEVCYTPDTGDPEELWRKLAVRYSIYHAELMLLGRCGRRLAGVLTGGIEPLQIIFSDTSIGTAEHLYESGPSSRVYNTTLQAGISKIVESLPEEKTIRILEIGAGTGGTTSHLLSKLPMDRTEYVFTDVSDIFLTKAEQKYRNYPFVRYQILNIEGDPIEQGFEENSFDLIIASNVIHATRDVRKTLKNVQRLLASKGMFALLEITNPLSRTLFLIFGLLKGFWLFQDLDLRSSHPLLSEQKWMDVLKEVGFTEVAAVSDRHETVEPEQSVILAQAPQIQKEAELVEPSVLPTKSNWLIFADSGSGARQLDEQLKSCGDRAILITRGEGYKRIDRDRFTLNPRHSKDIQQLLEALKSEELAFKGIVHMWSLDASLQEITSTSIEAAQELGCLSVVHLVQELTKIEWNTSPRLWLVTSGAQPFKLTESSMSIAQSPLCGLGKVIFGEHPELRCTMVDLSVPLSHNGLTNYSSQEIGSLFEELLAEDTEDEILLRGGSRYVNRIVRTALEGTTQKSQRATTEAESFRLEIVTPGVLDNLILRAIPRQKPKFGEVEIQIHATGVNFRDVMQAMGLLSGEALEMGYAAGVSLGLECTGKIVAIGEGVTEFQVGDEVMAVGRNCFAAYMTASTKLVLLKPAHISFEEAATIPTTFLTAYYALHYLARIRKGERVLIHGAAGGVGLAAIQIVQQAGGEVFATAGSAEKREFLKSLGIQHVMDSRSLAFADQVMEITNGEGVHIVLNSLAGEAIPKSLGVLKRFGRFLEIGKRDFLENSKLGLRPFLKNLSFYGIDLDQLMLDDMPLIESLFHELMGYFEKGLFHPLPHRVFSVSHIANAFRYMQQSRHIGKIVVSIHNQDAPVQPPVPEQSLKFRNDGTYLITGGLGGFGLATAQWLVEHGARHLVLVGRRGAATPEAQLAVDAMEQAGAQVMVAKVDVSQEQQVGELLFKVRQSLPPLRGVFHTAMVLEDSIVLQLNEELLKKVMNPKVIGAWNLHAQTLEAPLDFFVLYSSITSLFGNPGQGNYVAANAFLDAMAHYRRAMGRPALTINWGALAEVGYVAERAELGERMSRRGLKSFKPEKALKALGRLLQQDRIHVAVADFDWSTLSNIWTTPSPKWSHFVSKDSEERHQSEQVDGFRTVLLNASPEEQRELVTARLYDHVAKVLGTSATKLDSEKPIIDLGFDSLMAVELRARVENDMGVEIPVMQLMQGQNLTGLITYLTEQLTKAEPAKTASVADNLSVSPILESTEQDVDKEWETITI